MVRIKSIKDEIIEMEKTVRVIFVFRPEPQMPLFFSMYVLSRMRLAVKMRTMIKRKLRLSMAMRSLLSRTGMNFWKNGRLVSR